MAVFGCYLGRFPILYDELWAVFEGLRLASQLGIDSLEVESDSTTVVSWVLDSSVGRWDYAYLLAQTRQLLHSSAWSIRHVLREANQAADFMANWAYRECLSNIFESSNSLPTGISGITRMDAMQVPHVRC